MSAPAEPFPLDWIDDYIARLRGFVVVREEDCGDDKGVVLTKAESDEIGEPLLIRVLGRIVLSDIKKPGGRKVIVPAGELITEEHIRELEAAGVIGGLAPTHYSIMGYCPRAADLAEETAPAIAASLQAEGVDAALVIPV